MIKASDLKFTFDAEPLFAGVSFVLNDGDRVGLVGPNGTGKSTLLRLLDGELAPDRGSVMLGHGDRIGYLSQDAGRLSGSIGAHLRSALGEVGRLERKLAKLEARLAEGNSSEQLLDEYAQAQDRFTTLGGWSLQEQLNRALDTVGLGGIDTALPITELSGGQQARIMMAGVLLSEPTTLLLDEPTNHLDLEGVLWLEKFLVGFRGSVLVVSHDRRFLDRAVTRIFELDGITDRLQTYVGGFSEYRIEKQRRWERWLLDFEAQEKERKRIEADIERIKRQARSVESATRNDHARRLAAKMARQAKSREKMLGRQMKLAEWVARPETRPKLKMNFDGGTPRGTGVLHLTDVRFSYGEDEVLHGVDLEVRGQDRIAIVGANGSGKSTLLRIALETLLSGTTVQAGYLPQDHRELPLEETVLSYFRSNVTIDEGDARTVLDRFLFEPQQLRQPLGSLSGGERTRLVLAALVCAENDCLLLDEPTNHLDFDSLEVVGDALRNYRGTLVTVSHDRQFLADIRLTHLLALRGGRKDRSLERELEAELQVSPDIRVGAATR